MVGAVNSGVEEARKLGMTGTWNTEEARALNTEEVEEWDNVEIEKQETGVDDEAAGLGISLEKMVWTISSLLVAFPLNCLRSLYSFSCLHLLHWYHCYHCWT